MKSRKDIEFSIARTANGPIPYTWEPYIDAPEFRYFSIHVPTKTVAEKIVYGVTENEGKSLLEAWNNTLPLVWNYQQTAPTESEYVPLPLAHTAANIDFITPVTHNRIYIVFKDGQSIETTQVDFLDDGTLHFGYIFKG